MTTLRKDFRGSWRATDAFPLEGTRQLSIETYRVDSGHLVTFARVQKVEGNMITFALFGDFNERLAATRPARITSAVCEAQQKQALVDVDDIKARALAFYAEKATQAA
ncbi:MAG: hypothetical protein IT536_04425 [Hyphomicrobiales bacterium]|nr:hypothetical protein [Hyphomicrobiales bacterium]